MKVFREDKVYVQLKDLNFLFMYSGSCIPQSIYKKALPYVCHMDNDSMDDFIEFTEPEEVEFFIQDTFILDLDEAIKLSTSEYKENILSLQDNMNKVLERSKRAHKLFEIVHLRNLYRANKYKIMSMRESRIYKDNNNSIDAHIKRRVKKD